MLCSLMFTTKDEPASQDLSQAGVAVEPFFITTKEKPFNVAKFYAVSSFIITFLVVLLSSSLVSACSHQPRR